MKPLSRNIITFLLVLVAVSVLFSVITAKPQNVSHVPVSSLVQEIQNGNVTAMTVEEDTLTGVGANGTTYITKKEPSQAVTELLTDYGVSGEKLSALSIEIKEPSAGVILLQSILPTLILVIGVGFVLFLLYRQMQGANGKALTFGQSNAREVNNKKNKITFAEVAGNPEAKEELTEIVEFLKTPKKFADLGAKIPKGVLLMGPPGTGKTLISRAVAGEANVPFFHISGSEFVEMFVGVGASRVRDLFTKAKKAAPCIVFIDEIDAVGRQRGTGVGGGHDEREQTLNQILVEMDGFEPNLGIIVIAATNRPDVLDPALLRPGRFDRRVVLDRPDLKDRRAILDIHAKEKPLAEGVDLQRIAERTVGMSGADLANVMNEAAILAARRNQKEITQVDMLDAIEKVMLGPERKSHVLSKEERVLTAYHEAGHAIVGHLLPHTDDVHKISIISRGRAAGYTMSIPQEDRKMHSRQEFLDELAMTLGGYVTEKEIFGDLTTGASNDLQKATHLARQLVTQYGMSDLLGPRTYGEREDMIFLGKQIHENRDYSEKVAESIDAEINRILHAALETATRIVREQRKAMDEIVNVLLEKETIEKEEFEKLVGAKKKAPLMTPKTA
ncbi:ATP-dependent zinc metalloprotease FtsH [bacterium]|nr:ATP-dependent zinc metalloprotease FtsH [bacterium]